MSAEENKAIARRGYEAINQNNLDALDEVVASDMTDHDPAPGQTPGLEGVKQYFSSLHTAFPDVHTNVEDMIAEGDKHYSANLLNSREIVCYQDLRKNHLNTGILELLNEVIVQQTALDPVDRLPALVG